MGKKDPRVDAYIAKSRKFAQPILSHIRRIVHNGCPDVKETIKWGFPHFEYKGVLCSIASFKEHCAFGFWKGSLMKDPYKVMDKEREQAMGQFRRITSVSDLPDENILTEYVKEAAQLNDAGINRPVRKRPGEKKDLIIPDYFRNALKKNNKALHTFEQFSYSHQKEYLEWITEAKREETRAKRIETAVKWLSEGKGRNWKYEKC